MRPETVRRIEAAIEALGYRPSWAARNLKKGFAPVIGLLVPSVSNPFHGALARGIEIAAQRRGFQVVLGNSLRDPARERGYAEDFFAFGIRGVIIGSSPFDLAHFAELMGRGLSVVAFDLVASGYSGILPLDSVSIDNHRAGYLATRHLIELGHRRIGYISGSTPTRSRRDRLEGYRTALTEADIEATVDLIARGEAIVGYDDIHAAEHGRAAAHGLLQLPEPPTALVALNDMHALGACAAARDRSLSVPDDISVVGIDDIALAELVHPPLTTVHQPIEKLSEAAVDLLTRRIKGEDGPSPQQLVFEPHLVLRASTAAPFGRGKATPHPRARAERTPDPGKEEDNEYTAVA